jgi:acyl-CoA synthetase (AMP-forming)/AMP-acid ligase II
VTAEVDRALMKIDLSTNLGSVAVRQDGTAVTRGELLAIAHDLSRTLRHQGVVRVGCRTRRADRIAAAMVAGEMADCEVALLRGSYEDQQLAAWAISAVIEEDLSIRRLESAGSARVGFHVLMQTSGTTGTPKLARHTLAALTGRIKPGRAAAGSARWLLTYEPASYAGLQVLLTALVTGNELIAIAGGSLAALAAAALSQAPTHISGTPTFWRGLLVSAGAGLRRIPLAQLTLGGEVADDAILGRLRAEFPGAGITHIYASTEAGALFAVKDGRAGFPRSWLDDGTEGVRLRVTDGVLEVMSPRRMVEYVTPGSPSRDPDGWLNTGDLVSIVGDRVYFRGRADTVISVGGAKVSPEEVEAVLLAVPGVLDARVFPVSSPVTGNLVGAEIVCGAADREAVRRAVLAHAASALPAYKVPRVVRFVEALSVSASGKKPRDG